MKLYLHVGTEKTGSSHIQTLCVHGRQLLESAAIWFPEGIPRHEKRMREGLVSAGNGFSILQRACHGDHDGVLAELIRHREAAETRSCAAVFLSSELLLPYCAAKDGWQRLFEKSRKAGFDSVSTLVILRDPEDQLVSLYKHRARSGTTGRLDTWVREGYHLAEDLASLREQANAEKVELIARGYTRQPGGLESIFFDNWLNAPSPPPATESEVNPSLALSELELLRRMTARRPEVVPFLRERLSAVPRTHKVQGRALEAYARAMAKQAAWQHREEWQRWNEILPEGERLNIPERAPEIPEYPEELGFSGRQLDALAAFMADTATLRFWARLVWRARIRPMLGRVARVVGVQK